MAGRSRISIYLLITLFPIATYILGIINESNGLIWLALDTSYYYPVYVFADSLFERLEMGLLIPSVGGRCLAFVLYLLLLFLFFKAKDKVSESR